LPSFAPRLLIRPVATFGGLYLALWLAAWNTGAMLWMEQAIASTACNVMSLFGEPGFDRTVEVGRKGDKLEYIYTLFEGGDARQGDFKHPYHSHNLLLFAALALASPGLTRRQRGISLVAGSAAVFALDVSIVMGDFWSVEASYFDSLARNDPNRAVTMAVSIFKRLHPTGGVFMLPIFVWGFVLLGPFRGGLDRWLSAGDADPEKSKAGKDRKPRGGARARRSARSGSRR